MSHCLPLLGSSGLEGRLPGSAYRLVPFLSKQESFLDREQYPFLNPSLGPYALSGLSSVESKHQDAGLRLVPLVSVCSGSFRNLCRYGEIFGYLLSSCQLALGGKDPRPWEKRPRSPKAPPCQRGFCLSNEERVSGDPKP